MKTELCAYSVDACRTAARLGVDRVELCASPAEGGVTPSYATIERVAAIECLDVSVMIRPRGGDFLYSDDEFETMLLDIARAREAGATGVVFGVLTADGKVDKEKIVMLNITGGGEKKAQEGKELWHLKPTHVFSLTPDEKDVIAKVEAMFE